MDSRHANLNPEIDPDAARCRNFRGLYASTPANLDSTDHKLKIQIVRPDGNPLFVTTAEGKRQKPIVYAREGYIAPG